MEWVETTGRTLDEAKDAALDQLGVDEDEAEFEVLEEPKLGLFGRVRSEARVRARVRPTSPRPKEDRRARRRSRGARSGSADDADSRRQARQGAPADEHEAAAAGAAAARARDEEAVRGGAGRGGGSAVEQELSLAEQAELAGTFVAGLVDAFGVDAAVEAHEVDDETVEVAVTGGELGLLIGPRGATLAAVQEITRTAVQRRLGGSGARIFVDVAGYRRKRKEALERFTREIAEQVLSTGVRKVLEPMQPADRKVVHDVVNTIEGVTTTSEGEEPNRRVVIQPA